MKKKNQIFNSDVRFSVWLLKLFVQAGLLVSVLFLAINTYKLVLEPFAYNTAKKENKVEEHVKEILNEDSIIFFEDEWTAEKVDLIIEEIGADKVNDYIIIELIAIEICLMLTVYKGWVILTLLMASNIKEPFTDINIKATNSVIKLEFALIIISAVSIILEDILFMLWGSTSLSTSSLLSSFGSISTVVMFTILKYILEIGKNKLEKN